MKYFKNDLLTIYHLDDNEENERSWKENYKKSNNSYLIGFKSLLLIFIDLQNSAEGGRTLEKIQVEDAWKCRTHGLRNRKRKGDLWP